MAEKKSWGIIGGGILGMTLALRLKNAGHNVTIFESDSKAGGLASAWNLDGIMWDKYYHVILMSDLNTRRILKEIGLEDQIKWVETKTGFYSGGKLYSMSNIFEFLQFPPINLIDKFRLGLTIIVASKIKNWQKLEQVHVVDWLTCWSGRNVFEKIWLPLLRAKLGENYKETSAAFIWATIQRMYAARKSGLKKEMFGYVTGGYNVINEKFAQYLIGLGVEFRLNSKVKSITPEQNKRVRLQLNQDQIFDFDHIISTLSPGQSVKLAASLPKEEKIKHNNIKYLGVICPSVLMKKPVSPYYVTNITDTGVPFTGIIELTALIDKEKEMKGKNLVYLPKYVNPDDPLFESNDEDIRKIFLGTLLDMYPQISAEDILYFGVARSRIVFALPTIGYSLNLPGIRTSIDNFFIINSAQIINGTLNVNETIQVAESKLREIL